MSDQGVPHDLDDDAIDAAVREAVRSLPVPGGLVDRIERAARTGRRARWRQRATTALAAAALFALTAVGWMVASHVRSAPAPDRAVAAPSPSPPARSHAATGMRPALAEFPAESTLFGRNVASDDPRVTIIFIYQGVDAAERDAAPTEPGRNES